MATLFTPLKIRTTEFKNRIFLSPMCQYSTGEDGIATDWHRVHYGARAVGGAALIMVEATAVAPEGRITPGDLGLWSQEQMKALQAIARFIKERQAIAGIQLAHAGRKASSNLPWKGGNPLSPSQGGWNPLGPSPLAFGPGCPVPMEMSSQDIERVVRRFADAAERALEAGFEVAEIHMAHGYLLHEFLSPLSNHRSDEYGGSPENRMRLPLEVARVVRRVWPEQSPVFVRISATDWVEGGWDLAQSVELARNLKKIGVDLIDCSSGGLVSTAFVPYAPGFQVPFAATVKRETGIATGAVGLITEPDQAEEIIERKDADAVFLGRELLRNPYWPLRAAQRLRGGIEWPRQYLRAKPE